MLRGGVQSAQNLCFAMADDGDGGGSGRNAKGKKGTGADCKSHKQCGNATGVLEEVMM